MVDEAGAGAELWALANLATPMALRVAATLRIADHIAAGQRTATELAEAVDADADALNRLLRYLTKRGIFSRDAGGHYALTALGEALRDDHPARMRAGLDIEGVGHPELAFVDLMHSIRTGEAAFPKRFGYTFWDDLASNPARAEAFNEWMASDAPARAREIIAGYDWGSLGHVVDVGGGNGTLMIGLLTEYPDLRGTVLDHPDTVQDARKALAAAGLADRGDVVPGSFFDPLPSGAGGYLLSFVVHNWNDGAAAKILRNCAQAAGADGRVFIVENIGADAESPPTGMDLRMLIQCGGKERGLTELAEVAADSGLRVVAVHAASTLAIVELTAG